MAHSHIDLVTASGGGGDRLFTETRLVRTRASVDTVLSDNVDYGPRNFPANAANTSEVFAAASRRSDEEHVAYDTAMTGDVYKLQIRIVAQRVSGDAIEATASIALNDLDVHSV